VEVVASGVGGIACSSLSAKKSAEAMPHKRAAIAAVFIILIRVVSYKYLLLKKILYII
jgi:hypothetical protein